MLVTEGMFTEVKYLQPSNASLPILVTEGKSIEVKDIQPSNALFLILLLL